MYPKEHKNPILKNDWSLCEPRSYNRGDPIGLDCSFCTFSLSNYIQIFANLGECGSEWKIERKEKRERRRADEREYRDI